MLILNICLKHSSSKLIWPSASHIEDIDNNIVAYIIRGMRGKILEFHFNLRHYDKNFDNFFSVNFKAA